MNNYTFLCTCRITTSHSFTWNFTWHDIWAYRPFSGPFCVCTQALTPTANNDIASATASTVMSNQYVSIVPECPNGSESAVWLCCACICEVNWLKFEKLNHSKWWMSVSGSNQTDACVFMRLLSVWGTIIWVSVRDLGAESFLQGKVIMRLFLKNWGETFLCFLTISHAQVAPCWKQTCRNPSIGGGGNFPFQHHSNALIVSQCCSLNQDLWVQSVMSPYTYKCKSKLKSWKALKRCSLVNWMNFSLDIWAWNYWSAAS